MNQHFYDRYTPAAIRRLAASVKTIMSRGQIGAAIF